MVEGSRLGNFPTQMNLSEFGSARHRPAPPAALCKTVGGYMRGERKEGGKEGKARQAYELSGAS